MLIQAGHKAKLSCNQGRWAHLYNNYSCYTSVSCFATHSHLTSDLSHICCHWRPFCSCCCSPHLKRSTSPRGHKTHPYNQILERNWGGAPDRYNTCHSLKSYKIIENISQPFEDFIWKNSRMTHQNGKAYYKLSLGFCSPTFSCSSFAEVQGGGGGRKGERRERNRFFWQNQ